LDRGAIPLLQLSKSFIKTITKASNLWILRDVLNGNNIAVLQLRKIDDIGSENRKAQQL
jgi:hypothetical protein